MKVNFTVVKDIAAEKNDLIDHAIIGISPFNGYFTEEHITELLKWSLCTFKYFHFFIPDQWSIYTLLAQGHTEQKAKIKTKKRDFHLRNKVVRAFKNNNISEEVAVKNILMASTLMENRNYKRIYNYCIDKFNNDESFKDMCLETSRIILSKSEGTFNDETVHVAVQYFLHELPLYLNTPNILMVPSSFCVYHNTPNFIEYIYKDDILSSMNQGFIMANVID